MIQIFAYRSDIPYGSNSYLIRSGREYAIVDPSLSFQRVVNDHPDLEGNLRYILITHAHFDHFLNIEEWQKKGGEVVVGLFDGPSLSDAYKNCYLGFLGVEKGFDGEYRSVKEGDILPLGEDSLSVIDCPGHTMGGVAYRTGIIYRFLAKQQDIGKEVIFGNLLKQTAIFQEIPYAFFSD